MVCINTAATQGLKDFIYIVRSPDGASGVLPIQNHSGQRFRISLLFLMIQIMIVMATYTLMIATTMILRLMPGPLKFVTMISTTTVMAILTKGADRFAQITQTGILATIIRTASGLAVRMTVPVRTLPFVM